MEKPRAGFRIFSTPLKRDLVKSIDTGKLRVSEVCRLYEVSATSVYRWMEKYSIHYRHQTRLIVEKKSSGSRLKSLEQQIKDLKAALGEKQMKIDYLEKLIEITGEELGVDIEKKGERSPSNTSVRKKGPTTGR